MEVSLVLGSFHVFKDIHMLPDEKRYRQSHLDMIVYYNNEHPDKT